MSDFWFTDKTDELAALWNKGLSCSKIAAIFKTTDSAVAGRVLRLRRAGDDRFPNREEKSSGGGGESRPTTTLAFQRLDVDGHTPPEWQGKPEPAIPSAGVASGPPEDVGVSLRLNAPVQQERPNSITATKNRDHDAHFSFRRGLTKTTAKPVPKSNIHDEKIALEQRKVLLTLEAYHCRWPVGDPKDPGFFFCGAPRLKKHPYCLYHTRRAWAKVV